MTALPTRPRPTRLPASSTTFVGMAPLVLIALLPLFLLFGRGYEIGDPDTFWHIRAGDYLREGGQFSGPDPWSPFTSQPWVLHEWLPQLAMSLANQIGGLGGVAWLWYAGSVGVAACVYVACRREGPPIVAALGTVLGLLGMWASLSPRPQLVTFAFTALTTAAWLTAAKDGRRRWWLVPLTWVWACSHGMWFVGPLVGIVVVAGLALDRHRRDAARRLMPVPLLCVVVAAATPTGPALLTSPLTVAGYTRFVSEWDPPQLRSAPVLTTLVVLAVVAVVWARASTRPDLASVLLWVVALGWTLAYTRTVAVGAAIAAPLFVGAVSSASAAAALGERSRLRLASVEARTLSAATLVSLALALMLLPTTAKSTVNMPSGLNPDLNRLPPGTVVVNEYGFGGWLRFAHPELVPVIDERTELFSVDYVEAYLGARSAQLGWSGFVTRTRAKAALLPIGSPLADALSRGLEWRTVATLDGFVLLTAPGP